MQSKTINPQNTWFSDIVTFAPLNHYSKVLIKHPDAYLISNMSNLGGNLTGQLIKKCHIFEGDGNVFYFLFTDYILFYWLFITYIRGVA